MQRRRRGIHFGGSTLHALRGSTATRRDSGSFRHVNSSRNSSFPRERFVYPRPDEKRPAPGDAAAAEVTNRPAAVLPAISTGSRATRGPPRSASYYRNEIVKLLNFERMAGAREGFTSVLGGGERSAWECWRLQLIRPIPAGTFFR